MNRREFLVRIGGTLVAVPVVLQAIGCGDDSTSPNPASPHFDSTSDSVPGHSHNVTILCTQLTSAGAVHYTSTTNAGHSHSFDLSAAQLTTVNTGGTVNITSSSASGHTHQWFITKPGGVC